MVDLWRRRGEVGLLYAIIETGGKQYRVSEGDVISVERLSAAVGERVELDRVLAVARDDGQLLVGKPFLPGSRAIGRVLAQERGKKIMVFKYKPKIKYRRKIGHRQELTRLLVEKIEA